jgi:hypothetical protein
MTKPSKYKNIKTVVDGITFSSKAEAKRYGELKLLEKAGEISDLELQPRYALEMAGFETGEAVKVATYVADFSYFTKDGDFIVEDVKGFRTEVFKLKKKMVKAQYGIDIQEIL